MRRRQCAAHSGARTAEKRNSSAFGCDKRTAQPIAAHALQSNENSSACGCDKGNAQPTEARALQRDDVLRHSDATKAMRSPQRRTHCIATKLVDPWLPGDGSFFVLVILVKYVVLLVLLVKYVICHTVTVCYTLCCDPRK